MIKTSHTDYHPIFVIQCDSKQLFAFKYHPECKNERSCISTQMKLLQDAIKKGWREVDGKHYCPACLDHLQKVAFESYQIFLSISFNAADSLALGG